jgi:PAS domain S-box-containing protein
MRDITEKKATGRKIKLLAHSLESISECVTITNSNDLIIFVNDSLLKTYGYSENELIGQHINILRPDVLKNKRARDIFAEIPGRGWRGEIMNVRKNGQIFPVLLSTSCIKDENDNEIAMIGVAIDITEIRKNREELIAAKEKAEESNRLKTAFLATMNHELRTPLNHIIGFSDLILSGSNPEESLNYATFISHSGKNLLSIIEDVFDLALVENANIKLRNQTFSLVDHFMENKASFDEIMKNSSKYDHIRLIYKPDTNCLQEYVTADRSKINQVLTNLFKNAVKFTQHGTIEFGYRFNNKSNLSYYVTDTGIGIPQDKQDIIFDFFRQVDDSVTRNYGGIGIGLAISLKIARILKGELTVVSELGKGSTFTLTIPVVVPDI